MHGKSAFLGAIISLGIVFVGGRAFSGDAPDTTDAGQPGPDHKALEQYVGDWDVSGTVFTTAGDLPLKGHQSGTMLFGGRYLQLMSDLTVGGQPAGMLELVGYDNLKGVYVHVALDDQSTSITVDEGKHDATKKATTLTGTLPLPGGRSQKLREVVTDVADGAFHFESHVDDGSGEKKVLEATITKKK